MRPQFWRMVCVALSLFVPAGLSLQVQASSSKSVGAQTLPASVFDAPSKHSAPLHNNGTLVVPLTPKKAKPTSNAGAFLRYAVKDGDTLFGIAQRYNVRAKDIKAVTGISSDLLKPGQVLRIPLETGNQSKAKASRLPPGVILYTVRGGESLAEIRGRYGVSERAIINANPNMPSLDHLKAGWRLLIPTSGSGLLLKLQSGIGLLEIAARYKVPLTKLVAVNGLSDPRQASGLDYVLVPGLDASESRARLEKKRAAENRYATVQAAKDKVRRAAQQKAKEEADKKRQALQARQQSSTRATRASIMVVPDTSASYGGYRWPMRGFEITSGFGRRRFWIGRSNFHTGIDLQGRYRAPIYAAKSGYVTEAGWGYFGLNVRVNTSRSVTNIYGHMSRIFVRDGEWVNRGELIGYQGCTGICTGPHLHFEIQINGTPRNPLRYLP